MKINRILLTAVFWSGCSHPWVRLPEYPHYPKDLSGDEICRIVASRTKGIKTLRAEDAYTSVDSPLFSGSCRIILLVDSNGFARIKGYRPFLHITLFDAVATPDVTHVYVPRRGTLTTYRYPAGKRSKNWTFSEFVNVVLANIAAEPDEMLLEAIHDEDWLTIGIKRQGRLRERLLVDRRCLLVHERTLLEENGSASCVVTYNFYSQLDSHWWPRKWEVRVPERNIHSFLEFNIDRLAFNRELSSELFILKVPPDVERIDAADLEGQES